MIEHSTMGVNFEEGITLFNVILKCLFRCQKDYFIAIYFLKTFSITHNLYITLKLLGGGGTHL